MYKGKSSRLFPVILVIIIMIIAIAILFSVARALFFGGDSNPDKPVVDTARTALLDTSAGHSVKMRVRGQIVAKEQFRTYEVSISPNSRQITFYKDYVKEVEKVQSLGNNVKAYEEFVYALDNANFMKGDQPSDENDDDVRGICATGRLYEFEVIEDGNTVKRLWTSTCSGSKGTLDASTAQLKNLFTEQIPDSEDVIQDRFREPYRVY